MCTNSSLVARVRYIDVCVDGLLYSFKNFNLRNQNMGKCLVLRLHMRYFALSYTPKKYKYNRTLISLVKRERKRYYGI